MKRAAILFVLFSVTPALAQQKPAPKSYPVPTLRLDITEDENVSGETATNGGSLTSVVRHPRKQSLIRPRADFMPELLRSAENL